MFDRPVLFPALTLYVCVRGGGWGWARVSFLILLPPHPFVMFFWHMQSSCAISAQSPPYTLSLARPRLRGIMASPPRSCSPTVSAHAQTPKLDPSSSDDDATTLAWGLRASFSCELISDGETSPRGRVPPSVSDDGSAGDAVSEDGYHCEEGVEVMMQSHITMAGGLAVDAVDDDTEHIAEVLQLMIPSHNTMAGGPVDAVNDDIDPIENDVRAMMSSHSTMVGGPVDAANEDIGHIENAMKAKNDVLAMVPSHSTMEGGPVDAANEDIDHIENEMKAMMPSHSAMVAVEAQPRGKEPETALYTARQQAEIEAGHDAMKSALEANFCDLRKAAGGRFKRYMDKHAAFAREYRSLSDTALNEFRMAWVKDCVP